SLGMMPIPQILQNPRAIFAVWPHAEIDMDNTTWHQPAAHAGVAAVLSRICLAMQAASPATERWRRLDKLGHSLAAALYARPAESWDADYRWWCERTGTAYCGGDVSQILTEWIAAAR